MPSDPLFSYRRTGRHREITVGASFRPIIITAMLLCFAIVSVATGHAELIAFVEKIAALIQK